MFGLSFWEIAIILGIALLILGPSKLPEMARSLGMGLRVFRKATDDFRSTIEEEMHKPDPPKLKDGKTGAVADAKDAETIPIPTEPQGQVESANPGDRRQPDPVAADRPEPEPVAVGAAEPEPKRG